MELLYFIIAVSILFAAAGILAFTLDKMIEKRARQKRLRRKRVEICKRY